MVARAESRGRLPACQSGPAAHRNGCGNLIWMEIAMLRLPHALQRYSVIHDDHEALAIARDLRLDSDDIVSLAADRYVLLRSHSAGGYVLYKRDGDCEGW